ncbi:Armc2, partial [Symbiodinium sp. CCMP2592]
EKRKQTEFVSELCERTWVLATDMKAGKSPEMSLAPRLLREVMGLMDMKDLKESKLIFKLARSALVLLSLEVATQGVPVSGVQAAYQNISQVLFKYSQKEGNDTEFLSEKLIEPLLEVLESESPACCAADLRVYIVGILKNVSNDTANQKSGCDKVTTSGRALLYAAAEVHLPVVVVARVLARNVLTGVSHQVGLLPGLAPLLLHSSAFVLEVRAYRGWQRVLRDHLGRTRPQDTMDDVYVITIFTSADGVKVSCDSPEDWERAGKQMEVQYYLQWQ